MVFEIRRAERRQAKLRLALMGVSGSGKTKGALRLAAGMGKKILLIDTERKSADLFSNLVEFDVITLPPPFTPERYIEAVKQGEAEGYDVIIIDSLSHAWAGEGGILEMHEAATVTSNSKNSYAAWRNITPQHNKLINAILSCEAHIIATMRVKTAYEILEVNGKKIPVKLGLAPIQKEGLDYEFTTVLSLDKDSHLYTSSKDRTQLFEGKHGTLTEETGKELIRWLNSGKSAEEVLQEEKESADKLKQELLAAETIEALRESYRKALGNFPKFKEEFLAVSEKRKFELDNREVH